MNIRTNLSVSYEPDFYHHVAYVILCAVFIENAWIATKMQHITQNATSHGCISYYII